MKLLPALAPALLISLLRLLFKLETLGTNPGSSLEFESLLPGLVLFEGLLFLLESSLDLLLFDFWSESLSSSFLLFDLLLFLSVLEDELFLSISSVVVLSSFALTDLPLTFSTSCLILSIFSLKSLNKLSYSFNSFLYLAESVRTWSAMSRDFTYIFFKVSLASFRGLYLISVLAKRVWPFLIKSLADTRSLSRSGFLLASLIVFKLFLRSL